MLSHLRRFCKNILRYPIKHYNRKRLKNREFTLISRDCTGGFLLNDLGLRFDTPTINVWFYAGDFVKFCSDLKYYLSQEMIEDSQKSIEIGYPVGILGGGDREVRVWFMHGYEKFSDAKAKWEERSSRVHWDNVFLIMTDGNGSNEEIAREFDSLPYEHKAFLTYRDFANMKSAVKLGVKKLNTYGIGAPEVFAYKSVLPFRRFIDEWDYVNFFNSGNVK